MTEYEYYTKELKERYAYADLEAVCHPDDNAPSLIAECGRAMYFIDSRFGVSEYYCLDSLKKLKQKIYDYLDGKLNRSWSIRKDFMKELEAIDVAKNLNKPEAILSTKFNKWKEETRDVTYTKKDLVKLARQKNGRVLSFAATHIEELMQIAVDMLKINEPSEKKWAMNFLAGLINKVEVPDIVEETVSALSEISDEGLLKLQDALENIKNSESRK